MDRRNFIRVAGLAGGGMLLSGTVLAQPKQLKAILGEQAAEEIEPTRELAYFVKIDADNNIRFQLTKHEMGQGVNTGLAMILAEELCADWEKVQIEFIGFDQRFSYGTGGSTTILDMWQPLRKAGATARQLLLQTAARRWQTDIANCTADKSIVINTLTKARFTFGELAAEAAQLPVPENVKLLSESEVPLKDAKAFQLIGKSLKNKVVPQMVTGKYRYSMDAKVEGMRYAAVARCPVFRGKLKSFDASAALRVEGVEQVVPITGIDAGSPGFPFFVRDGVAVIADSTWAAMQGKKALKIEWEDSVNSQYDTATFQAHVAGRMDGATEPRGVIGNADAVAAAAKKLTADYVYPYQAHVFMEPLNCIAQHRGDHAEVWIGTQSPVYIVNEVEKHFGIAKDRTTVHLFPSGGGFGRRYYPDAALEGLLVSKAAGNIPVKVVWSREDDVQTSHYHIYYHGHYEAGLDDKNNLIAWLHKEARTYWGSVEEGEISWNGYLIPNKRYDFVNMQPESALPSCAWRSVIANGWAFGQECFLDEVAHAVKKDPLQFRLELLREDQDLEVHHNYKLSTHRLRRVLQLAAEKANWGKRSKAGFGKGIAVYPYMHGNGYCAQVAEVSVRNGQLKVHKVVCAVDCGHVVNPDLVKNQIEGGVLWGMSALLYGGVEFENGQVLNSNFHNNRVVRMNEVPDIEVYFVENPGERPWGVGELAPPPAVPAIANAIFAACGVRVRKLPVRPESLVDH
ncbi:MAG: molybdopterin cofactor-binding domain-containing protein [Saprospiraceae bacterium]